MAAGTGEVFSYVVHHHPPVPGKRLPMVVALVQLPEGVRMVGEMPGVRPDQVRIGLPVRVAFVRVDDDLTPARLAARRAATLPDRVIDVTPTFVIASALATRDFQDVHHDRDRAVARGRQGHLRQHPDHDRAGPAVRLGLGPGRGGPRRLHPARRALLRRRDAHPQRARSPRPTATSAWSR